MYRESAESLKTPSRGEPDLVEEVQFDGLVPRGSWDLRSGSLWFPRFLGRLEQSASPLQSDTQAPKQKIKH